MPFISVYLYTLLYIGSALFCAVGLILGGWSVNMHPWPFWMGLGAVMFFSGIGGFAHIISLSIKAEQQEQPKE
jgi:hypothetical protein